jgi:hypothetical protein
MQHRPNPGAWLLLEGTAKQHCKTYNYVWFVLNHISSFHIPNHDTGGICVWTVEIYRNWRLTE